MMEFLTVRDKAIEFLRARNILKGDATHFVITFEDGRKEDVTELLSDFAKELLKKSNPKGPWL